MDAIILQLSQIIQNKQNKNRKEAGCLALREIILSGLSRSGFLKQYSYLPSFDTFAENKLYLSFLDQKLQKTDSLRNFLPFVDIELKAAGTNAQLSETENGFNISADDAVCVILLIRDDFGLLPAYIYQQTPIPYEIRSISEMNEGTRRKLELLINEKINGTKPEEKIKPAKSSGKNKRKKKEENSVQQLSLFDF